MFALETARSNYAYVNENNNSNADFVSANSPVKLLRERSTILGGDINLADQLIEWVGKKFGWHLCYRASEDGWQGKDFHGKCDDVGPTVTLVKRGSSIFGGYTDQSWKPETGRLSFESCLLPSPILLFCGLENESENTVKLWFSCMELLLEF